MENLEFLNENKGSFFTTKNDSTSSNLVSMEEPQIQEEGVTHPAVEKAFEIRLILQLVLKNLNVPHLKACRLVGHGWSDVAGEILQMTNATLTIIKYSHLSHFNCDSGEKVKTFHNCSQLEQQHHQIVSQQNQKKSLLELNQILQNSTRFPSTHFVFLGGDLASEEVEDFFEIQGPKIYSLEIERNSHQPVAITSKTTFQQILLRHAPNLQNLKIKGFDYDWPTNDDRQFRLHALKNFQWEGDASCKTVAKILAFDTTPNLNTIKDIDSISDLQLVINCGRGNMVRCLKLSHDLEHMDPSWTNALTQLKKLTLNVEKHYVMKAKTENQRQKMTQVCRALLSIDTLEELEYTEMCATFDINFFPIFPHLRRLVLGPKFGNCAERCFPAQISLAVTFPKLKILDCTQLRSRLDYSWGNYFPPPQPTPNCDHHGGLDSVKSLEISDSCTELWMEFLHSQICPNFNKLVIHGGWEDEQIHELMPHVFDRWTHLVAIEVVVNSACFKKLDPAIMGVSEEVYEASQKLMEESPEIVTFGEASASIRNLKELKTLKISLGSSVHRKAGHLPITSLAVRHALKVMPGLQITLEFDHGSKWAQDMKLELETLAPLVNFAHRYDYRNAQFFNGN